MRNRGKNLGYQEEKKIFLNLENREERESVLQNLENREEEEKLFCKSWKSRGEREIVLQNLDNREEKEKFNTKILWTERGKRNVFSKSWKSRGERDMKIHFSSSREKTRSYFSSRISRDWDSCQGLVYSQQLDSVFGGVLFTQCTMG